MLTGSVALATALVAAAAVWLQGSESAEAVRLAVPPRVRSAAVFIAQDKGYFADAGVAVTLLPAKHGLAALEEVAAGRADMATAAGVTTLAAMAGQPLSIIATLSQSDAYMGVVARRGIATLTDLRGKRIGMFRATSSQVFPVVLLGSVGVAAGEYTLVHYPQEKLVDALASGEVDALSLWNPVLSQAQARFGDQVTTFYNNGSYVDYWVLAVPPDWLERNDATARKLLKALSRAARYAADHPDEARAIVGRQVPADNDPWDGRAVAVRLDSAFAVALKHNAEIMFGTDSMPNLTRAVQDGPLRAVAPSNVTIGR